MQLLQGASEELRRQGPLEADDPANVARAREERKKRFGPIGADRDDRGSKPRRQQSQQQPLLECAFCRRLGETRSFARTHVLRDPLTNAVVCPILREHRCEICGATGDSSHTRSYCPKKPEGTHNMALLKSTPRNSTGKRKK
ncbi:nanos homolog 2-like [Dermacentor silvarum]|uniref:nanos homolog 2-like n=1 Tax=Dermacentor silvarum TaxID=543639 RepID=UPI002101695D|nr:nanos homolog 2-like [Dermacentor silvarum]